MRGTPINHMIIAGIASSPMLRIHANSGARDLARAIKATAILPPTDEVTEIRAFVAVPAT